jgi:signal transduction histidine kinase/DNA-binding NarL/FixJ family response regulator
MSLVARFRTIQRWSAARSPVRVARLVSGLLILLLLAADLIVVLRLREDALVGTERHMSAVAQTLAEQADRAVQGVDLVLEDIARLAAGQNILDGPSFNERLGTSGMHETLLERMVALPQLNALILYGLDGHVVNTTRSWSPPAVNIRDTDYFRAMTGPTAPDMLITAPFQYKTDGVWTVFFIRPFRAPDRSVAGLLVAAIELHYFEEFYRSVSVESSGTFSLLRGDGVQLSRFPPAPTTGQNFMTSQRILGQASAGTIREPGLYDNTIRIKAARRLKTYPLIMLLTIDEAAVLGEWRGMAWLLGLTGGACGIAILIAATALARHWRHREALSEERESRANAEAALMRERERSAENESRAKSGFLAMMSHEIRTPMNGVLGLTGTLLDTPLTADQRGIVEAIRDSGDSLLRILNDVLDLSKLDSGRMELEQTPFSPATLTQNPLSLLGPRAAAKGLKLTTICDDPLPDAVLGDAGRIRQILINLVSNAVKFTAHGSITIRIACPERDDQSVLLVWSVSDTGIGIPEDRLGRLFSEFSQADASITRRFGGSGLGLAISKRLIEQMGGTIAVESVPDQGSTFTVTLRLPIVRAETPAAEPPIDISAVFTEQLGRLGRTARILFAEDNPTNQFVALRLLRGFDLQVDVVADGLEAVHGASSFPYDVICMDMRMPQMDGLAATRAIRAMGGRQARVPVIALTANAFPEDVAACFAAGMTDFVAKPIRKEALLNALRKALEAGVHDGASVNGMFAADQAEATLDRQEFERLIPAR